MEASRNADSLNEALRDHARVRRRFRLFLAFAAGLIVPALGCATLRRHTDNPESVGACRQLSREGLAAMEHGDDDLALSLLEQAVKASPTDVDARRQLAEILWKGNAKQEAVNHIQAAVKLDPRHAPTLVRSGEMLLAMGDPDAALERADQALVLDTTLPSAWALRGRVYRKQGQQERALADFYQALRYNPHASDVLLDAAELQYQLGRPQRCLTTLQNLLESYPAGEEPRRALWLEGLAYTAVNRPGDAVNALYAASSRGPAEPELLFQLARAQMAAGQTAAAAATAREAADAGHEGGRSLLAQLQGQGDGATGNGTVLR